MTTSNLRMFCAVEYQSTESDGYSSKRPMAKKKGGKGKGKERKGGIHNGSQNRAIATSFIHFLNSSPTPAAIPISTGEATPIASVGTNTALFPNAATREISC